MRIPASILGFMLLFSGTGLLAQQSSSSDQSQGQTQGQSQSQSQSQTSDQSQNQDHDQPQNQQDKSSSAPAERKRLPLGKQPTTADENPFPEDISKKAAAATGDSAPSAPAPDSTKPPSSSNGSKPSGHPDYSSSRTGLRSLDDKDSDESRISDGAGGYVFDPKLAGQDIKVGSFYYDAGDYKGAYARFKEATKVDPTNADAVYRLAEAARALKLNSEAANNYRIYLDALPDGPKAKAARKALAAMGEGPKK